MERLFVFLFGGLVAWGVVYELLYSPRATIKRLWKEIFTVSYKMGDIRKRLGENYNDPLTKAYERINEKKKKMIKTLLEYYFDPEEDEEYIRENTP